MQLLPAAQPKPSAKVLNLKDALQIVVLQGWTSRDSWEGWLTRYQGQSSACIARSLPRPLLAKAAARCPAQAPRKVAAGLLQ